MGGLPMKRDYARDARHMPGSRRTHRLRVISGCCKALESRQASQDSDQRVQPNGRGIGQVNCLTPMFHMPSLERVCWPGTLLEHHQVVMCTIGAQRPQLGSAAMKATIGFSCPFPSCAAKDNIELDKECLTSGLG